MLANAKVINITPTSPEPSNNLRIAINNAVSGDIIEMAAGTYDESGDYLAFTDKEVTVRAAEGAEVILKPRVSVRVKAPAAAAKAEFIGIKFDCSEMGSYSELFVPADDQVNQKLILKACEIYNWTKNSAIIRSTSARRFDVIEIDDCYFHNCLKSCVFLENAHLVSLSISNSTFADITTETSSFYAAPIHVKSTEGEVTINHCTFYNVETMSSSYGVVTIDNIDNVTISNSIFAHPTTVNQYAVSCVDGSTIDYCLAYKTNGFNHASTNDRTGNPYFRNTNPANYDFTIWTTSPAHGTANDGYDLGDYTRWNTDPATHVATINITAEDANSLKAAVDVALPGDEIILAAGTYEESESISLDKEITIKAADGASSIVKPVGEFAISNGVEVTIQGIKFDATSITGNLICSGDATAGNQLTLDGCEFYGYTQNNSLIRIGSAKKLDACTINDCYFHNIKKSCFFNESTAASNLTITNSTFANITTAAGDPYIGVIDTRATAGSFLVDHCTFYNVNAMSTDYAAIGKVSTSGAVVSNCIFAMPSAVDGVRAIRDVSAANNCLTFNYIKDSNRGIHDDVTKTNCIFANPLFADAENGDFTFPGDNANDNVSPARNAGTDGSDLGDPRWYTPAIYPTTDFSGAGYVFTAAKAKLTAGTTIIETNESAPTHPYIRYTHSTPTGNAEWVIQATKACYVQATVNMVDNTWTTDPNDANMFDNHKHIFVVEVRKANNTLVGSVKECEYNEDGSTDGIQTNVDANPNVILPGQIYIPEAGVYTIILRNPRNGSRCGVGSVTLAYAGGDVQTITNTANFETNINDAYFSANGSRADGKISFSGDAVASEWLRWNVTVANSDYYDITLNSDVESGHIYSVTFYDGETQVARVAESAWHNTTGALDLGRRFLPAGDYVMEIKNSVSSNSNAKIVSIQAVAFVAPIIALPNTLPAGNAITSELAYEDGGELYFTPSDKRGYILDQWAKWKVSVSTPSLYLFTMNVSSTNEQSYKITILDSENNELESYAKNPGSGAKTIKHYFELEAGNYFVMVQNTTNHSDGHMISMVVSEPEFVTLDENAESNSSWESKVDDGTYDVRIIRSFRGGMNNTFCLPFEVSSSQCKEVFGNDVEIYTLGEATIEDYILNLTVNPASDIYPGTPVLIKPSHDIENPVFTDVTFTTKTASSTPKTHADFVGSFVKTPLSASDDLLYVGPENKVFFLSVDYEMPGMRAWFFIHDVPAVLGSPKALRSARIIEKEQITTSILNVETSGETVRKVLYNGQIVIIRGNEMYNMQGQHIQ